MDTKWNVGDVVRLRLGSTLMTVGETPTGDGKVLCIWFVDSTLHTHRFSSDAIQAA